jgi:hypothetical protein
MAWLGRAGKRLRPESSKINDLRPLRILERPTPLSRWLGAPQHGFCA